MGQGLDNKHMCMYLVLTRNHCIALPHTTTVVLNPNMVTAKAIDNSKDNIIGRFELGEHLFLTLFIDKLHEDSNIGLKTETCLIENYGYLKSNMVTVKATGNSKDNSIAG